MYKRLLDPFFRKLAIDSANELGMLRLARNEAKQMPDSEARCEERVATMEKTANL